MQILKYSMILASIALFSCSNGPKRIEASQHSSPSSASSSTGIFDDSDKSVQEVHTDPTSLVHVVTVKEVLPTEKYVYLYVSEGPEEYWLATSKQEVQVGEKYSYTGGLLKTNFESKEYKRTFDKVYLVSGIQALNPAPNKNESLTTESSGEKKPAIKMERNPAPGSISIAEIVKNPGKYGGTQVQISGECTKLNANIMGKNWIHLKDGSADDYDFVLTSSVAVPEGHYVTMKGDLVLDKDFGSGYRYKILVENANIVH